MASLRPLDKWRDNLKDLNFWLDGYRHTDAYQDLLSKLYGKSYVHWNVGVPPAGSFTRAISAIAAEAIITTKREPLDHVIKVELNEEEAKRKGLNVEEALVLALMEKLGPLYQQEEEHIKLKEAVIDLWYYYYGTQRYETNLRRLLGRLIGIGWIPNKLFSKSYLLVIDNLYQAINSRYFQFLVGTHPGTWTQTEWVLSTASRYVLEHSKVEADELYESFTDDQIFVIVLSALHLSANCIFTQMHQPENKRHWHLVALKCFHYAMLLLLQHPASDGDGDHSITPDELIRGWAAQGFLAINMNTRSYQDGRYDDIYQVGNTILKAFQDYSVLHLPFSPATDAMEATKTAAHFLAYHNLIAEPLFIADNLIDEMEHKKWISLMENKGWHISSKWLSQVSVDGPTTLILRHCSQIPSVLFSKPPLLACLRVLDFSYTPLSSFHNLIWCLPNLHLLSLRGCHGLTRVCNISNGDISISQSPSLHFLDLSYSDIDTFHCDFFKNMENLHELLLDKCSNLVALPPSINTLSNLKTLHLTSTQINSFLCEILAAMKNLQTLKLIDNKLLMSMPLLTIHEAQNLEVLHIEGWQSNMVEEIKLDGHATLKSLLLIDAPKIRHLSMCGCTKLESVELKDLGALEELDLSSTAIKELPSNIPNLPKLGQLLLRNVPSIRRFPWHELQRVPDVFCLDHCADGNGNGHDKVAQVCINDPRLFHSFNEDTCQSVRNGQFFQSFYVRIAPCTTKIRKVKDEEDMLAKKLQELVQKKSPYPDLYSHCMAEGINYLVSSITPPIHRSKRHVKITAMDRYLGGLMHLLDVAKSIYVSCDYSISTLSSLSSFSNMEECELKQCHQMEKVFQDEVGWDNLRKLHASNLKSLNHLYHIERSYDLYPTFCALKHIHLEYCPRLEDILPCRAVLPSLETLDILFCYNLKTVFYTPSRSHHIISIYKLPRLQRIRLQELPQLQHIYDDDDVAIAAPMWKELHARGCWSLCRLPRLEDQQRKVEVNGERSWWRKLLRSSPPWLLNSYVPKLPPEFASFNERAQRKSYLR